jgi:hypothetical protein
MNLALNRRLCYSIHQQICAFSVLSVAEIIQKICSVAIDCVAIIEVTIF